jgi:hypothetical protein
MNRGCTDPRARAFHAWFFSSNSLPNFCLCLLPLRTSDLLPTNALDHSFATTLVTLVLADNPSEISSSALDGVIRSELATLRPSQWALDEGHGLRGSLNSLSSWPPSSLDQIAAASSEIAKAARLRAKAEQGSLSF